MRGTVAKTFLARGRRVARHRYESHTLRPATASAARLGLADRVSYRYADLLQHDTTWLLGLGLLWLVLTIGLGWILAMHRDGLPDYVGLPAAIAIIAAKAAIGLLVVFTIGVLIFAGAVFLRLRQLEASDWVSDRAPDPATLHAIIARENEPGYAQNHMVSLTQIKPGWLRSFTLRLVFWAIATVGPLLYKAGHQMLAAGFTIPFAKAGPGESAIYKIWVR